MLRSVWQSAIPIDALTIDQWADGNRQLSPEASAEPGPWRTDRVPYMREVMREVTNPSVAEVVLMTSSQVAKTEIINNVAAYFMAGDPCPIMWLLPTIDLAKSFAKTRLKMMIRDTPALNKIFQHNDEMLHLTFPGGHCLIVGANAPTMLSSTPVRLLLMDEVDRFPVSAGKEGDPVSLAKKRTTTFADRKIVLASTPTNLSESRIHPAYENSDKRRFYVPCPQCSTFQVLVWPQVRWPDNRPDQAYYECPHCYAHIYADKKPKMLARGKWIAENPFNGVAGFHLNELYSPWKTFGETASDFVLAKDNTEKLKVWINTALGEAWNDVGQDPALTGLDARVDTFKADLPAGVLALTAGVDVQDDRLCIEVVGWGHGEENWSIAWHTIQGDPAADETWQELTEYLTKPWTHEYGVTMFIGGAAIDSGGHFTDEVYAYTRVMAHKRFVAVKGSSTYAKNLISKQQKHGRKSRLDKFYVIGTETAKDTIYARLRSVVTPGPGYSHFGLHNDADYFEQLTSEKKSHKFVNGFKRVFYVKIRDGIRNEALDCRVYAFAMWKLLNWDTKALQKKLDEARIVMQDANSVPRDENELPQEKWELNPVGTRLSKPKITQKRSTKGFVQSWRKQ